MTARTRLRKIEQERARRAGRVLERIIPLLTDSELDRLAHPGFEQFTTAELEAIASGAFAPQVEAPPIDPAMLARLSELCESDEERRLIGVPTFDGFKHPDYRFQGAKLLA